MQKKRLDKKIGLISKFMVSQPGKQTITIHILLNISRSKGNQTMEFGKLVEYKKKNIFPQKSWRKSSRKASSKSLFIF